MLMFASMQARGQVPSVSPPPVGVAAPTPTAVAQVSDPATLGFVDQLADALKHMGGAGAMAKISTILMLLIASMKVSIFNELFWSKLGLFKIWLAPVLGLIAGALGLGTGGAAVTPALLLAFATAGGGAVFLHELLDLIKVLPGVGPMYVLGINLLEKFLGGPAQPKA